MRAWLIIKNTAPAGAAFALTADVPLGTADTLYSKLGDWVGWLCLAGFVFFTGFQEVSKRQGKATREKSESRARIYSPPSRTHL